MIIGVDATAWFNTRGYGRHFRSLINAVIEADNRNQYVLVFDAPADLMDLPQSTQVRYVRTGRRVVDAASVNSWRSLPDIWDMSRALSSSEFDLVFFPTVYSVVPVLSQAIKILMIHDVIPECYPHLTLPTINARWAWKIKSAIGRWQADRIVTVSDYSRKQLSGKFRIPPDKISVVGEASAPIFQRIASVNTDTLKFLIEIPDDARIIVYVGGFGPHKNLHILIDCFAKLLQEPEYSDLYLLMVGEDKREAFFSEIELLRKLVDDLNISDKVKFTGFIADFDLVRLFNIATVMVLPSLMEGYGLPAIEAAACGCPVIATRESAIPDILGSGGLYFDPRQPLQLEHLLREVMSSYVLRQQMSEKGLTVASQLSWESAAHELIQVFEKVS